MAAKKKTAPDKMKWRKGDVEILTPKQAAAQIKAGKIKAPKGKKA